MRGRTPDAVGPVANLPAVPRGVRGLVLSAPDWLASDPEAAAIFAEAADDLAALGAVRPADRHGLALWSQLTATATRALRELAAHPDPASIAAKRLQVTAHSATDKAARLAGEYGLTPVSRLRLGLQTLEGHRLLAVLAEEEEE
jgi:phage terminase small subunit